MSTVPLVPTRQSSRTYVILKRDNRDQLTSTIITKDWDGLQHERTPLHATWSHHQSTKSWSDDCRSDNMPDGNLDLLGVKTKLQILQSGLPKKAERNVSPWIMWRCGVWLEKISRPRHSRSRINQRSPRATSLPMTSTSPKSTNRQCLGKCAKVNATSDKGVQRLFTFLRWDHSVTWKKSQRAS